jgi:hypothetical protein
MLGGNSGFVGERHDGRTITWGLPCRMSSQVSSRPPAASGVRRAAFFLADQTVNRNWQAQFGIDGREVAQSRRQGCPLFYKSQ